MFSPGEIAELEKKYSKYIFKKKFKVVAILLLLAIVLVSPYYFLIYSKKDIKTNKKISENIVKVKVEKKEIEKIIPKANTTVAKVVKLTDLNKSSEKIEVNTTKPNLAVELAKKIKTKNILIVEQVDNNKKIENQLFFHIIPSDDLSFKNTHRKSLALNILSQNKEENIKKISKKVDKNDTIGKVKDLKPKIKIQMRDIDSVRYLKEKYEKTHNIIFALMLCEEFYSQKDYDSSLKWSIIANDIDNQSERSWIWFAKSKYRLGKKDDAIRALRAYLRTSDSNTVQLLLKSIQNGSLDD
jgi:hypothetical protein